MEQPREIRNTVRYSQSISQLIFDRRFSMEKLKFTYKLYTHVNFTKIKLGWIIDLNAKTKTVNFLKN